MARARGSGVESPDRNRMGFNRYDRDPADKASRDRNFTRSLSTHRNPRLVPASLTPCLIRIHMDDLF